MMNRTSLTRLETKGSAMIRYSRPLYGQILPKAVLDIPTYHCINVHASLLPKYRGAAPINKDIVEATGRGQGAAPSEG
mgnify:CR=1 FL=1